MRIRTFCKFVEVGELQPHQLKDTTVVIDGQNLLHRLYLKSELRYEFGCESDKYAQFLKNYLIMFKKANVKCYFIIKGGSKEDVDKSPNEDRDESSAVFRVPIFTRLSFMQVLDDMKFDYVVSEYNGKSDCIAFAQKYMCPLISFDIEFCFSDVSYIPSNTLRYNDKNKSIECGAFHLQRFLDKYDLSKEQLAMFVVLRDTNIFPENYFDDFIKSLKVPNFETQYFKVNIKLLTWLSRTPPKQAVNLIFNKTFGYTSEESRGTFLDEFSKFRYFIGRRERLRLELFDNVKLPSRSRPLSSPLYRSEPLLIKEKDPKWFEKGVALKYIAIPYINLYHYDVLMGSFNVTDKEENDPLLLSIEIIKYAYDLLKNFQKETEGIKFHKRYDSSKPYSEGEPEALAAARSIRKPEYKASESVFENGWSQLRQLRLFEHFLIETLQHFDFENLEKVPEDARLLFIALVYFSRKKVADTTNLVYSVLFSYVMLNIVIDKNEEYCKANSIDADANVVTESDCDAAHAATERYFKMTETEREKIFDKKLTHPSFELQHCIENFNFLNKLCGAPYKPTVYSKTFNGTFVYKVVYAIEKEYEGDCMDFFKKTLNSSPTVLLLLNNLIELYERVMY